MAVAMIGPKFYAWDRNGKPLAFGKLYTYQARTNTPKPTYQSEDQQVENTNPVILNGEGYANVYLDGSYKMVLKDDNDNEIWSSDPVTSASATEWVNCMPAEYVSPSTFKVAGNFVDTYEVGRAVRLSQGGSGYDYASITDSSYAGGFTTVVIAPSIVTVSIENVCTSIVSNKSVQIGAYTDYVFKNENGNSAIENMINGYISGTTIGHVVGNIYSTGGTTWEVKTVSSPMSISDFSAIDAVCAFDYGVVNDEDQDVDQTSVVQSFIDSNQGKLLCFGDLKFMVTKIRIPGGSFINWGTCNIKGRVQYWVSLFSWCYAERATIQYLEIIGSQHANYSNISGDLLYLQNNVEATTGMYWLAFHGMHFKALQVRQAAYANGTLSGFNVINFYDSTFKGGNLENEFTIGSDTFGANVWIRDQIKEDASGGTYKTYTEDGTDLTLVGDSKWSQVLTQPLSFNGFDFSYSTHYTDPATVKSYGILNEGQPTVTVSNGFIEGVEYSHENVKMDLTVECRPAGGKLGVPVNVTGQLSCSGSQRLGTKFGNLLAGSMPIELNTEFKNALSSRYNISIGGSFESKSNLPFVSNSTGNRAIKLDNSGASYARLEYRYIADETGVISVCVRGSDIGSLTIKSGSGPTIFGLGYKFIDENKELYSVGTAKVVAGEEVLITVVTRGQFGGGTPDIAYITGFGVFKGRFATSLEQWQERSDLSETSSVVISDQSTWTTIATLTGGNFKSDSIKLTVSGVQTGGSGSVVLYWEGEIKFNSTSVLTLTERVNIASIVGSGSTEVKIRLQEQSTGVVEIQLQKGFYGASLDGITIDSLDQVTEQLLLNVI